MIDRNNLYFLFIELNCLTEWFGGGLWKNHCQNICQLYNYNYMQQKIAVTLDVDKKIAAGCDLFVPFARP